MRVVLFLFALVTITNIAQAQPAYSAPLRHAQTENYNNATQFSLSPGLSYFKDAIGMGTAIGILFPTGGDFLLGFETGAYFWKNQKSDVSYGLTTDASTQVLSVPILAVFMYRKQTGRKVMLHLGLAVGASYTRDQASYTSSIGNTNDEVLNRTGFQSEVVLRPGVDFILGKGLMLSLEPRFGFIGRQPFVAPHAGLLFSF